MPQKVGIARRPQQALPPMNYGNARCGREGDNSANVANLLTDAPLGCKPELFAYT
jgi:hypothetical protein